MIPKKIHVATLSIVLTTCAGCFSTEKKENTPQATLPTKKTDAQRTNDQKVVEPSTKGQQMAKKERIILPSGLSYEVIKEPAADAQGLKKGQNIAVHYTGWLDEDGKKGTKFDSSVDRKEPLVFPIGVGYVIKGWDEGVLGMKVGEKRILYIPSKLGYGKRGAANVIPPDTDLIFEVELLGIEE